MIHHIKYYKKGEHLSIQIKLSFLCRIIVLYNPKISFKECFQLFDDGLFFLGAVGVTSEAAHRGKEAVDPDAGGFQFTVAEGVVDKLLRFIRLQIFLRDNDVDLFFLLLLDKCTPIVKDIVHLVHVSDEGLDQLFLAAQLGTGVNRAANIDDDLLILAVAVLVLLDEHEDIVDVDLDLLDQLDLKDDILCDIFLIAVLFLLPFVAQILISTKVGLQIALRDQLFPCEIIKRTEKISHSQHSAEQQDEVTLILLADDRRLREREPLEQLLNHIDVTGLVLALFIDIAVVIVLEALEQHYAAGFSVAEKRDRVLDTLLQTTEAHNVTKRLDLIQNTVSAGERLDQSVVFQVLVHPEGIQRSRVKAGEEHIDHDQQIDLLVLHPQRQILVVALEAIVVGAVVGIEHLIIIIDRLLEKLARALIQPRGTLGILFIEDTVSLFLVGGIAEDGRDLELLGRVSIHLTLELIIIQLRHRDGRNRKDGVEAADSLLLLDFLHSAVFRRGDLIHIRQHIVDIGFITAIGLLIEVVKDVLRNLFYTFIIHKRLFTVDIMHLFVVDIRLRLHRLDIVHTEGQDILVVDRVNDRIGVQLVAKSLFGGGEMRILHMTGVCGEDRRAGESEHMILFEVLDDRGVHIAELTAVALVKDDDDVLLIHRMTLVLIDKGRELLDRGDDNPRVVVLELFFQDRSRGIAVRGTLFKAVIFLHRLVVEVFSIHDKQHLVDRRQGGRKARGLEARQRFAGAGCVPDIPAARDGTVLLVVRRDLDTIQNTLGGGDLIRTHDHQHILAGEDAVTCQDIEDRVLGEKRLGEVDQIGDDPVVRVSPERGELKAVGGLALLSSGLLMHGVPARGVGVILGVAAVRDHKDLDILKESAAGKEAVALIAVDLVERLADRDAAAFELDMYHRQTVDEDRDVIAVVVLGAVIPADLILVDDLYKVVVDIFLVDQRDVLAVAVVTAQDLNIILLQTLRLLGDTVVRIGDTVGEKACPLAVREGIAVQLLELSPQIAH